MKSSAVKPIRKSRRQGRPGASEASGESLKAQVFEAAARVYAEHGFHRTTVALILRAADISRPTFYRMFKDVREVVDIVVHRAFERLRAMVVSEVMAHDGVNDMLTVGVEAYFKWCREIGPLVGPIYSEINDAESPVSDHRGKAIRDFVDLFNAQSELLGRPKLDPLLYEAVLRALEHVGSSAFWPTVLADNEIERRKAVAMRIIKSAVALPEDNVVIPPAPLAPL